MAEIVNDNIGLPGTVTSGADMDAKFDNARQASLTLNEKNVRSEGIDRRNLEGYSYPSGRVEPVVYMDKVDNNDRQSGSGLVTYAAKDGRTPFTLSAGTDDLLLDWTGLPGGGVTMQQNDLLRINYNIVLYNHNLGHTDAAHSYWPGIDTTFGTTAGVFNATGFCALFYPVWETSTTTGFEPLPGRASALNSTFGAPATINIGYEKNTDGCLLLSMEGILNGGITLCNRSGMVSAYYVHTSVTPMTIKKIRLNARMPVMVHSSSGTNREILMGDWTILDYAAGQAFAANFTFNLERGSLGAIVMRGDAL
jgi:hypothetical protein